MSVNKQNNDLHTDGCSSRIRLFGNANALLSRDRLPPPPPPLTGCSLGSSSSSLFAKTTHHPSTIPH